MLPAQGVGALGGWLFLVVAIASLVILIVLLVLVIRIARSLTSRARNDENTRDRSPHIGR